MTRRVVVEADEIDAELAGVPAGFDRGQTPTSSRTAGSEEALVVSLGAGCSAGAGVVWLDGSAKASEAESADPPPVARMIAQAGDGLWRVAPWPVADAIFDLEQPGPGAGVLVAGGDELRRSDMGVTLAEGGVAATVRERLALADLREAAVVILPAAADAPLPARAIAVLAAGRLLLTARCRPTFGLQSGIDHVASATNGDMARIASASLRFPRAFTSLVAFGRLAAAPHRASLVYRRLLEDIALEESAAATAPPRSPAPHG